MKRTLFLSFLTATFLPPLPLIASSLADTTDVQPSATPAVASGILAEIESHVENLVKRGSGELKKIAKSTTLAGFFKDENLEAGPFQTWVTELNKLTASKNTIFSRAHAATHSIVDHILPHDAAESVHGFFHHSTTEDAAAHQTALEAVHNHIQAFPLSAIGGLEKTPEEIFAALQSVFEKFVAAKSGAATIVSESSSLVDAPKSLKAKKSSKKDADDSSAKKESKKGTDDTGSKKKSSAKTGGVFASLISFIQGLFHSSSSTPAVTPAAGDSGSSSSSSGSSAIADPFNDVNAQIAAIPGIGSTIEGIAKQVEALVIKQIGAGAAGVADNIIAALLPQIIDIAKKAISSAEAPTPVVDSKPANSDEVVVKAS